MNQPDRGAWDRLAAPAPEQPVPDRPSTITLLSSAWGDLVALLAVSTACIVALHLFGHRVGLRAFPWALALAVAWWAAASAATIVVRRGSLGMLLAGLRFADQVPPRRVVATLVAALLQGCCFGLPALLGPRWSPLHLASGQRLVAGDGDSGWS
jgi:hypothetical protein